MTPPSAVPPVPPVEGALAPEGHDPYRVVPAPPPLPPAKRRFPLRIAILAALGLAAGASALAVAFIAPPAPRQAKSIGARLDLAAGDVQVTDVSARGRALSGTPLPAGATVSTGNGARALVRTGEGASLFLRGDSKVKLLEQGVLLEDGEVWLDAPRVDGQALEVKIGKTTVSATDAGLDVKREGDAVRVYVARGLAILAGPGGRVEIGAGEQAVAKADGQPKVSPVAFWQDWTGGMSDERGSHRLSSGSGRLYGIDPTASRGAPAKKLTIAKQVVHAVIRQGIAETEVDQTFANPGSQPIEGYYWFSVPQTATVTGFALETDGQLVEGEVIEKRDAAQRYEAAVHASKDPALLEWVDGHTYRARIFPVPASGTRRVVLRYMEMLPAVEGKTRYVYPLRSDDPVRFDEFALSVDVAAETEGVLVASSLDARVEGGGKVVSMRRSGYVPHADFQLELTQPKKRPPVSAWRFSAGPDQADYLMLRYVPEKDFTKLPPPDVDVVLVVDTSAGGDEGAKQLRIAAAEAALRALSDKDHFAVVALDVAPRVVYPAEGLASATEADITKALEKLADHGTGGATDLGAMFEPALARLHGKEQAAMVYVGDGAATSGETSSEALLERLRRSLTGSRARFFAIGTGGGARHQLLEELSRTGGGQYVRIDEAGQTTGQTLRLASAIKTPAITDLSVDLGAGLDQPLYSATGKLSRGEELVLLARTHHTVPDKIAIHGRLGGNDFDDKLALTVETGTVAASLVPRLWAAEYAKRLMGTASAEEDNHAKILQLGVEYGLITPYTSSLALDSEAAYAAQGIGRRRNQLRGVRLSALTGATDEAHLLRALGVVQPAPVMMGCNAREKASPTAAANGRKDEETRDGLAGYAVEARPQSATRPAAPMPAPIAIASATAAQEPMSPPAGRVAKDLKLADKPADRAKGGAMPARSEDGSADLDRRAPAKPEFFGARAHAARVPLARTLGACSDLASRPLAERIVLWSKRAKRAQSGDELAQVYDAAYAACELPDWRDEATLLDLLQQRVETEQAAETLLSHFASYDEALHLVAKNLLRRTVDVRIAATVARVVYGIDWTRVDAELARTDDADKQITLVKSAMLAAPLDQEGDTRLVRLLARAGRRQEAVAHGRRLRDRGMLTPTLARQLGDVLAESGETEEAMRTYSEIVEFDGQSRDARRVLGDVFLRQGWHPAAYRQFKTLTDLDGKNPLAWLRLATAAAGAGRIDEALRIEREIAGGEGSPGPNDPRMFARLMSASRLSRLLANPGRDPSATTEALTRKMKELSLFSGPGTLHLVVWDDLEAQLTVGAADPKKERLVGEATDAGAVGLYAVLGASDLLAGGRQVLRYKSDVLSRTVRFRVLTVGWDGRAFKVAEKTGELGAGVREVRL